MSRMFVLDCYLCGITFGMPNDYDDKRREDHRSFYCPNGHAQAYTGPTTAQKLQKELDAAKAEQQRIEAAAQLARFDADLAGRTCPWPTCEGRLLASPRGLRQHMVKAHGAPWATPELSADEVVQVVNGRDPLEVVR